MVKRHLRHKKTSCKKKIIRKEKIRYRAFSKISLSNYRFTNLWTSQLEIIDVFWFLDT